MSEENLIVCPGCSLLYDPHGECPICAAFEDIKAKARAMRKQQPQMPAAVPAANLPYKD